MVKLFKLVVLTLLASFLVAATLLPKTIEAQEEISPYQISYQIYLDQLSNYQKVHQIYILRKSQYASFKTLQSQQDLQVALVAMLQERDGVVIAYLEALKERVNENPGMDEVARETVNIKIDNEIAWFTEHKANIPTAGTLKDLSNDSNKANSEFTRAYPVFYEAIGNVSSGNFTDLYKRFDDKFTQLKEVVNTIKGETREEYRFSSEKIGRLDRWIFDAEGTRDRALEKQVEANALIATFSTKNRSPKSLPTAYTSMLSSLSLGQQYLRESGRFMQEIIRDIKTEEE